MPGYVIKKWNVSCSLDANNYYVDIAGRKPGVISWILSILGIDATVKYVVSAESIIYVAGSWSGISKRIIPIRQISSVFYGFTRPWKEALALFLICSTILGALISASIISQGTAILLYLIVIVMCSLYYSINKRLALGIQEVGGATSSIEFKRSIIEGKKLSETDSGTVCEIIEALMVKEGNNS